MYSILDFVGVRVSILLVVVSPAVLPIRSGGNAFNSSARVVYFGINFHPQVFLDIVRSVARQLGYFLDTNGCYQIYCPQLAINLFTVGWVEE
jgi:hypothetical protein